MAYAIRDNLLRFTTEPVRSFRTNPWPAGTVKLLIFTVVHFTASEMSSNDEIVPVHGGDVSGNANALARRDNNVNVLEIIVRIFQIVCSSRFYLLFAHVYIDPELSFTRNLGVPCKARNVCSLSP